jgi:NADPH2:quinone reductase
MKAIRFAQYGEPAQVLADEERPLPAPGPGEVRVRILASPINPSDLLFVRGVYAGVQPEFPAPVGFEGVGRVDALGPQVHRPVPGQRVGVLNGQGGNWADYVVLPAQNLLPMPDDLADEQIASSIINPASAILMLRHVLAIPQGAWLLQSAASSELGRMIIRLAKHDGIRTINVVRRREAVAGLERLGADAVVVSGEGPIDEQVRRIVGQEGVKYHMLVYGSLTGEPIRVGADPRFILAGRRILEVFWLGYWFPRLEESARGQLVQDIVTMMREGVLVTEVGRKYPLDQIGSAVTQAEAAGRQGKVFLVPERQKS